MLPIKALVFDTFGTVVDWRSSLIAEFEAFGAARGLTVDWVGLVDAWRAGYAPAMDRVRSGELPWTTLDVLHRMTLDPLLHRFGADGLDEDARDHLNRGWHRLHGWPDAVPGLTRLRTRFTIGPLSNGNVSLLVEMAKFAGLPWDMVFGADLFEHYKPDPQTYLGACALLDLPPSQVMMVAAHNHDLKAALAAGLRTAFIPRPTEYGPGQTKDQRAEGPWYVVADGLEDLATRLGC